VRVARLTTSYADHFLDSRSCPARLLTSRLAQLAGVSGRGTMRQRETVTICTRCSTMADARISDTRCGRAMRPSSNSRRAVHRDGGQAQCWRASMATRTEPSCRSPSPWSPQRGAREAPAVLTSWLTVSSVEPDGRCRQCTWPRVRIHAALAASWPATARQLAAGALCYPGESRTFRQKPAFPVSASPARSRRHFS